MNREFKFRAWDGKKMLYDIIPWKHDFVISRMSHKCIDSADEEGIACMEVLAYRFKEVMQYTGSKDRNGEDVYEGDIFEHSDGLVEVVWSDRYASFDCRFINEPDSTLMVWELADDYKVLGNIYENSELITTKQ